MGKSAVLSFATKQQIQVKGLTFRSQDVQPGYIFFALKGANVDGNAFIAQAAERGAALIVSAQQPAVLPPVPFYLSPDIDKDMADCAYEFYGCPSDSLCMYGITGTKGKTSIAYLLESILQTAQHNVGVFGTVNYRANGQVICQAPNTTPAALTLFKLLAQMKQSGCKDVVMEVSSHALELQRVRNIWYNTAIFTNLQRDHLDFHKTFENQSPDEIRYIQEFLTHTTFEVNGVPLQINLLGKHNVYNALAACAAAYTNGVGWEDIARGLVALPGVPGRMERIDEGQDFFAYVDFAYTNESLQRAFDTIRPFKQGKVFLVFGCGGQRDRTKRPLMGHTACEEADYVFLTNDNPRCEDPKQIFADILTGMQGQTNYTVQPDRAQAIEAALAKAQKNDIVIVAGKGHEDYQLIGTEKRHFSDQETVRAFLRRKHV